MRTSVDIVLSVFPMATLVAFPYGGCEVYENLNYDSDPFCHVLGSGISLEVTPDQEDTDYRSTPDAAWDHAASYVTRAKQWLAFAKRFGRPIGTLHERFDTFRLGWLWRCYKVNETWVTKRTYLQKLTLAIKHEDELYEEAMD